MEEEGGVRAKGYVQECGGTEREDKLKKMSRKEWDDGGRLGYKDAYWKGLGPTEGDPVKEV